MQIIKRSEALEFLKENPIKRNNRAIKDYLSNIEALKFKASLKRIKTNIYKMYY